VSEAHLIKSLLEANGIDVYSFDENWLIPVREVKLAVTHSQEELAREILEEYRGKAGVELVEWAWHLLFFFRQIYTRGKASAWVERHPMSRVQRCLRARFLPMLEMWGRLGVNTTSR